MRNSCCGKEEEHTSTDHLVQLLCDLKLGLALGHAAQIKACTGRDLEEEFASLQLRL